MSRAEQPALDWPTHDRSCACMGRGWFVEHRCDCGYMECVGCIKDFIPCDEASRHDESEPAVSSQPPSPSHDPLGPEAT